MIRARAALFAGLTVVVLSLVGCASGSPAAAPTVTVTVTAVPTPTPTPTTPAPTPTATVETAVFPTDCGAVGTTATRQATVDSMNLQGDGTGFVRPAPEGATLKLGCDWIVGDATGILFLISEATPSAVTAAIATLPAQGYTCGTAKAGNPLCTMTTTNSQYGTSTVETIYARDNAWIYQSASNIDGGQLLSDLAVQMWP